MKKIITYFLLCVCPVYKPASISLSWIISS